MIKSIFAVELLLFGDPNNKKFLGCLNCDNYSSSSIWNEYGQYGSEYSGTSIWNEYGQYGSKYSSYSVFNSYGTNPPVVVDRDGNFYGYLTCNAYKSSRCNLELCSIIYKKC
jgi:hypothetical protein